MSNTFNGAEEGAFLAVVDEMHLGNDHSKVADARQLWSAGKMYAANLPRGGMAKTSILKEANVTYSSSTGAKVPGFGPAPAGGLFKVVHGPLGSDGAPESVRLESLGEWDLEHMPEGLILTAESRLVEGDLPRERAAFECKFPPHERITFCEKRNCYVAINSDTHYGLMAERHSDRWETWQACAAAAKRQDARDEGNWQTLHAHVSAQRNHYRDFSGRVRDQLVKLSKLLSESVGMVRGIVGNGNDELADRIDRALLNASTVLNSREGEVKLKSILELTPGAGTILNSDVQRYEFDRFGDKKASEYGHYVLASDYDLLVAKAIATVEELTTLRASVRHFILIHGMSVDGSAARKKAIIALNFSVSPGASSEVTRDE